MVYLPSIHTAGALMLLVTITTGCLTVGGNKNNGVQAAAETERQTQVKAGQHVTPRDGMWGRLSVQGVLRNPDNSIFLHPDSNLPIPLASEAELGWNLTSESAGGLASADLSFGTVAESPAWRMPAWEMLRSEVRGQDVRTGGGADAIRAAGEAEALAKTAAGDAAAKILQQHYAGKVALMKVGSDWLVTLKDGTFGVLERVNPVAAGVSVAKEAVVVLKDGTTGNLQGKKLVADE